MKTLLALLLTAFIASTVTAAEKTQNKKVANTAVKSTLKGGVKSWKPTPFVHDGERLPANYTGVDPKKFFAVFQSNASGLKKREFETSEEHAKRSANVDALDPIKTSDLYAFANMKVTIKYDADSQVYMVGGNFTDACELPHPMDKVWVICKIAEIERKHSTYTAQNAFGASAIIDDFTGSDFWVALKQDALKSTYGSVFTQDIYGRSIYQDRIPISLEKARILQNMKVGVVFVGRVTTPEIIQSLADVSVPTINSPQGKLILKHAIPFDLKKIIYYVFQTGEILAQRDF